MPFGLVRYHQSRQTHFVTFSCYRRLPKFNSESLCALFLRSLEDTRGRFKLRVYGYVVMPEHVHLLLSEPAQFTLADAIRSLKLSVSMRAKQLSSRQGEHSRFWLARYYDLNVRDYDQFVEKLRYIHRNPVKRGLVSKPEDWVWSSFRHYALREIGPVEIESEWTARQRRSLRT